MSDPQDPRLHELLHDAVSDVDPRDRLHAIQSRTKVTTMSARRPWLIAIGASAAAAVAVVVGVTIVNQNDAPPSGDPGPAASSGRDTESTEPSSAPATPDPTGDSETSAWAMYFVGDTPQGPRLYREFQTIEPTSNPEQSVIGRVVGGGALDPDYRSLWPTDTSLGAVTDNGDVITVDLVPVSGQLRERPAGMTEDEASLAVQQVIYTAQAAFHRGRAPVQLLIDGQHSDMVLGVPAAEPLANDPVLDTLSLVSLSTPNEGEAVAGDTMAVEGVANSFEANVPWQVQQDSDVVLDGFFMADGTMGTKLYPFAGEIDISSLSPGTYTLRVQTDDPSGGEGGGPYVDTRTFTVG